jgi:hypothetical protein
MEPILLPRSLKNAAAIIFLLFSTECKTRQQANTHTSSKPLERRLRRNAENEFRKHEGTQKPSIVYSNALPRVLRKLEKTAVSVGDVKP